MAGEASDSRSKGSKREKLRSALSHRKAADAWLDAIKESQDKWNDTCDKLAVDTAIELDTNYAEVGSLADSYEADGEGSDAQHKASLRASMRSALSHRKLADELADSLEEQQASYTALLAKLDAEASSLNDGDYVATLGLDEIDRDSEGSDAQHKQSLRRSLRSALADRKLADEMLDAMQELQSQMNAGYAVLDTDTTAEFADFKVSQLIDPDSE